MLLINDPDILSLILLATEFLLTSYAPSSLQFSTLKHNFLLDESYYLSSVRILHETGWFAIQLSQQNIVVSSGVSCRKLGRKIVAVACCLACFVQGGEAMVRSKGSVKIMNRKET